MTSIDQTELDLYDLVEEVGQNQTFYNILNIDQVLLMKIFEIEMPDVFLFT